MIQTDSITRVEKGATTCQYAVHLSRARSGSTHPAGNHDEENDEKLDDADEIL